MMSLVKKSYAHKTAHAEEVASIARGTSALIHDHPRADTRQPTETPRKQAISTMFVKYVRNVTVLANQRMQASSRKRIRKLIRNNSPLVRNGPDQAGGRFGISGSGEDMDLDER